MEDCVDLLSLYFKICKNVNACFFYPKGFNDEGTRTQLQCAVKSTVAAPLPF